MLKAKDLHDQSIPELEALSRDLYKKLFDIAYLRRVRREGIIIENLRNARKDLARVLTILTEKKAEETKA